MKILKNLLGILTNEGALKKTIYILLIIVLVLLILGELELNLNLFEEPEGFRGFVPRADR